MSQANTPSGASKTPRTRKYWIGANWKCNGSINFIKDSVQNMYNDMDYDKNQLDLALMPGMLHLPLVQAIVNDGITVCAQNVSATGNGAYTGEVSADALADYRIQHVLIGHNERRKDYEETQEIIDNKVKESLACSLNLVYCVGESTAEHEAEKLEEVLNEQLQCVKEGVSDWGQTVLVYEPLWAMGTGFIASGDQTQEACHFLRSWVKENVGQEESEKVRICYGASITETNVENLVRLPDVDGFLVGSTSTKPIFRTIFDLVNKHVENDFKRHLTTM